MQHGTNPGKRLYNWDCACFGSFHNLKKKGWIAKMGFKFVVTDYGTEYEDASFTGEEIELFGNRYVEIETMGHFIFVDPERIVGLVK